MTTKTLSTINLARLELPSSTVAVFPLDFLLRQFSSFLLHLPLSVKLTSNPLVYGIFFNWHHRV